MIDKILTAESVSEGHPDKIADQIADAVLDAILEQDPNAKVACEALVKTGMVLLAGEIGTSAWVDLEAITRKTIQDIGYVHNELGFEAHACAVLTAIGKQSADIHQGVSQQDPHQQGAGDQGIMVGYATDETDCLMPAPILYAHRLMQRQGFLRRTNQLPWLRPDAKAQVSLAYENGQVSHLTACVLSTQHTESVTHADLKEAVMEELIKPVLPAHWIKPSTQFFINPTGRFVLGGPYADCGLTGRKLMVDTYGPLMPHGGGAFSGKDPSKVDRSGAYMARYLAKQVVAASLAKRCQVVLAYAIGIAEPVDVSVNTFGTGLVLTDAELGALLKKTFSLTPYGIIETLKLRRPIYRPTAAYGHFGRLGFSWEETDGVPALLAQL